MAKKGKKTRKCMTSKVEDDEFGLKSKSDPKANLEERTQEKEVVDYAATADEFFEGQGLKNGNDVNHSSEDVSKMKRSNQNNEHQQQTSDVDNDDDDDNEEDDEVEVEERGNNDNDSDEDDYKDGEQMSNETDEDDENGAEERSEKSKERIDAAGSEVEEDEDEAVNVGVDDVEILQSSSSNGEPCTFDLRNMVAINSHQINSKSLYNSAGCKDPMVYQGQFPSINEAYLLEKAFDGCTQLVSALWQLPKEKTDAGIMVQLPSFDGSRVPRALPPPEPKVETKWEKFAKERGIPMNKNKRSQKVWDEATGTWMFRHGYNKANDEGRKEWPIMEVKGGDDPYADPWEKAREAKRARVEKNTEQRMRNQERAGNLARGTTARLLKSREKIREAGRKGGNMDRDEVTSVKVLPSGVPVDLKPTKTSGPTKPTNRGKQSTLAALTATQRSTASMGRFDKMREDEPERRISSKSGSAREKRKQSGGATDKPTLLREREQSLKVLKTVVDGGGATKERDIRKGRYAKGETAYDYEFDDGLGPSSFKKRKGRAGAGKATKMTKKRIK